MIMKTNANNNVNICDAINNFTFACCKITSNKIVKITKHPD